MIYEILLKTKVLDTLMPPVRVSVMLSIRPTTPWRPRATAGEALPCAWWRSSPSRMRLPPRAEADPSSLGSVALLLVSCCNTRASEWQSVPRGWMSVATWTSFTKCLYIGGSQPLQSSDTQTIFARSITNLYFSIISSKCIMHIVIIYPWKCPTAANNCIKIQF